MSSHQPLALAQAELVRALVAHGPIPAGFDEARLRAVARSLLNKRRQALARAWPSLAAAVGECFIQCFNDYADRQPLPACGTTFGDGRAFLRWLDARESLNDAGRLEAMAFDLRHVTGSRRRRGITVKLVRLRERPALAIAVRLPWLGERWWQIPLGKPGA